MLRTHTCGDLRAKHEGLKVTVAGWAQRIRNLGGLVFIDVRDRYGLIQVVVDPEKSPELAEKCKKISRESVIKIEGKVQLRPDNMVNKDMLTGEIEIAPSNIEILSDCADLPIQIDEITVDAGEELRLKHRYLELRRPSMQMNLYKRNKLFHIVREHLRKRSFWEVDTPFFMRSTPEGARDFLVPSRINPGKFYALPQSPQTYKQILMVAGIDKYFQIARCFRDEDFRADRQPEFTQIDIEMSFVEEEDIFSETEKLMSEILKNVADIYSPDSKFKRMTYDEAVSTYGTDKPDIRFGSKLYDVTEITTGFGFKVFDDAKDSGGAVIAMPLPGIETSRKQIDETNELARKCGLPGVVAGKWDGESFNSPLNKFIHSEKSQKLLEILEFSGSTGTILLTAGERYKALEKMGQLRLKVADKFEIPRAEGIHCLWVTDFPMFEPESDDGVLNSSHHPFTAPQVEDIDLLEKSPHKVRSRAYDLVINGYEIASGSIRIHDRKLQERIFALLGVGKEEAEEKFGFLLRAFEYGVPPHGGIALGFDRLLMILCGCSSIREVIPFPKTTSGLSLMDGAPAEVAEEQLRELGISLSKK